MSSGLYNYNHVYKRWTSYYSQLMEDLNIDKLLLIDDAGDYFDFSIPIYKGAIPEDFAKVAMYRFDNNLGRYSTIDFPGWWRSFLFAYDIAQKFNYQKIIHIESDCYILSPRLIRRISEITDGWNSLYSRYYEFPETCVQVICEDSFEEFRKLKDKVSSQNYRVENFAELLIPFTNVIKEYNGDRLGEEKVLADLLDRSPHILANLDYIAQIKVKSD